MEAGVGTSFRSSFSEQDSTRESDITIETARIYRMSFMS
jgi:hypothetical protein